MCNPHDAGVYTYRISTPLAEDGIVRIYADAAEILPNGVLTLFGTHPHSGERFVVLSLPPGKWDGCNLETPGGELYGVDRRKLPRAKDIRLIPLDGKTQPSLVG